MDGRLPQEQIDACHVVVREILAEQEHLPSELQAAAGPAQDSAFVPYADLEPGGEAARRTNIFAMKSIPLLTPQGMDPAHPFPFISNLSINLLVSVRYPDSDHSYLNRIKVPVERGYAAFSCLRRYRPL